MSTAHSGLVSTIDKSKEMSDRKFVSDDLSHVGILGLQGIGGKWVCEAFHIEIFIQFYLFIVNF